MSFMVCTNAHTGRGTAIHYASVIMLEDTEDGGTLIHYRAGNTVQTFRSPDGMEELLRILKNVRREDINSFDPD